MTETEYVTITRIEYLQLLEDSLKYLKLEAAGVDNWEWYSDALYGDKDGEE